MDWSQLISSIVSILVLISPVVGWVFMSITKLDKRTTVLESSVQSQEKTLNHISQKVSDVKDDVQIIKVCIAKMETKMDSRSNDSNLPARP